MADWTKRSPPSSGTSSPTAQPPLPGPSQPHSAQSRAPSPDDPHSSASAADVEELYDRAVAQAKSQDPQHKIRGNLVLNLPNLKLTCSSPYLEIGWSFEFRLKGVIQPWIQRICIRKEKPPADRYAEDVGDHVWFGTGYGKTPHEKRLPNPFFTRPDVSVTPREKGLTLIHITPRLEGEWYYGVDIYFKDTKRRFHKAGWVWTKEKLETVAKDSTLRDDHERDARQRWL